MQKCWLLAVASCCKCFGEESTGMGRFEEDGSWGQALVSCKNYFLVRCLIWLVYTVDLSEVFSLDALPVKLFVACCCCGMLVVKNEPC